MQQQRSDKGPVPGRRFERGYVTLLAALIVTIVGVSLASSLLLSGGSGALRVGATELMSEARAYADACAEKGLADIQGGVMFAGDGQLSFSNGSCSYTVDPQSETWSQVQSTAEAESAIRKVYVDVETNIVVTQSGTSTEITGINWQEVDDL